jgi:DNA helicase-2/ATP-dependent DNA helicase PcrA
MAEMSLPPYLEVLNPEQRKAVLHVGRPLLILAGAGSGKTRVITTKIAWLVREQGVDPRSILAVTFTNKAAREMAERARLIDDRAGMAMLRTFHSFGAWFLRRNGALGGLASNFVIYDEDDSEALVAALSEGISRAEARHTARSIARAKDFFLSPEDPELDLIDYRREFRQRYARYEERLAQIGNVDFGDLIKKPVEILRAFPEVAGRLRDRFRVIMVDEYQDSNIAQFELLKELWDPAGYLCVVGDDDQSIYRFRGAEVRNILEFPRRFPDSDIIRLERNYRSFSPILALASSVVDHNEGRLGKNLISHRGAGKAPALAFLPDQDTEAEFCAELIENAAKKNIPYSDWAVLYRTNAQSLGFETLFLRRRIPYRVVGSLKFYEREEIKDSLALLAFLANPRDEIAFRRMANKPARGAGPATVDRIVAGALAAGEDLGTAAKRIMPSLGAKARAGLAVFFAAREAALSLLEQGNSNTVSDNSDTVRKNSNTVMNNSDTVHKGKKGPEKNGEEETLAAAEGLSRCVACLVEDSGIAEYHRTHDDISSRQRLANLQELVNAAILYPNTPAGLMEFLEHIELDRSMEQESGAEDGRGAVTLITLHNTKGLEFRRVIMTGIEQGVFPRDDKTGEDLEEERRLFYVGATRAMDELYLSSCARRRMYGRVMFTGPSLFISEADRTLLRVIGQIPYGFEGRGPRQSAGASAGSPGGTSSDGRWKLGDRVFHDDQGYGAITGIRESDEGPVIQAQFETGKVVRFLSLHQSSRYTKIGSDD